MPSQTYAIEPKGPRRLEISWGAFWKNVTVKFDGKEIGTFADQKEFKAGKEFPLPDGSRVHFQLVTSTLSVDIKVLRNGQPLPGSSADPAMRHQTAYAIIYFIAGLNVGLGLIAIFTNSQFLHQIGISEYSILYGAVFAALGYFTQIGSFWALIAATVLFAADTLTGIFSTVSQGYNPSTANIIGRIFLLWPMLQGIPAMWEMQGKQFFKRKTK